MESVKITREEVQRFLTIQNPGFCDPDSDFGSCDGSGSGDGAGSCDKDGFGFGRGDGYCTNCGSCFSYGLGSGGGYNNCSGVGFGFGNGAGSAIGSGGDDFGFGAIDIKSINGNTIDYVDNIPTIITQIRGDIARGYVVKKSLALEPCFISKVGNSFAHGWTLKEAVADATTKEMKRMPIEKRVEKFKEVVDSLDSKHTGKEFYDGHHILTGSCRMGRDGFCKAHKIDLDKKYTVRYFLSITKNAYKGDIIELVRKSYD